ncbi:glycosyl hydrolase family 17 protein [Cerasicoccus arenae]|uniref:Endo-1,3-beta-glucanase btgC n=1 Tax=Cerasicoccus arenae TaxID=424488 RepID=A0A8J3DEP5_9BACT|nr:glycosyl hydrolase family 17 protein [Cerasicoccus arenae]MBK1856969.1 hypothetical protein [Cerasicoccus arenae]GHB90128.1 hypothetical protein GCM10007047_00930 [Cerasicoccus arenae]
MKALLITTFSLIFGLTAHSAIVSDYSGASYSPYSIRYTDNSQIKGFGDYNVGDITGDLQFMQTNGITRIKTYDAGLTQVQPFSQIQAYITNFNAINSNPAGASSNIQTMNDPFAIGGGAITGNKWIMSQAAVAGLDVYQGTNVSSGMLSVPTGTQTNQTVTLLNSDGTTTRNVNVTPNSYSYTDFSGATKNVTYTMAHWDIELALMNIANGKIQIQQPASSGGNYTATPLGGLNTANAKALIIGNEVLSTGGLTAPEVAQYMAFAKARRTDYGLTEADLPITSSTNSPGNWQGDMATDVLPYVDGVLFYNTYGFPFSGGEASSGPGVTPENGIENVVMTQTDFAAWLATNAPTVTAILGEHGWPSDSLDNGDNSFNITNEKEYFLGDGSTYEGALKQLAAMGLTNFLFEMFDEPWKNSGNIGSSENHFGIATATQQAMRENPATDPSQYPEVRTMKFTGLSDELGSAIPEPRYYAMMLGAVVLVICWRRRK